MNKIIKSFLKSPLVKQSGVYGFTSLINAVLPFLLLPLLSYYLSPDEYGLVAMYTLTTSIFLPLVSLNSHSAIGKRYYYDEDKSDFANYIGNTILIILGSGSLMILLSLVLSPILFKATGLEVQWVLLALFSAACQSILMTRLSIWQMDNKPKKYALFQIIFVLFKLLLSLLFVIIFLWSWQGRVYAMFIAVLFLGFGSLWSLKCEGLLTVKLDRIKIKHALTYGVPLVPHSLAAFVIAYTDRLTINSLIDLETMGLYTVAFQVSSVFNMGLNAFNQAFTPWLFGKIKLSESQPDTKNQIVKVSYSIILLIVIAYFALLLVIPPIFRILSPSYQEAAIYVKYILLGFMFNGLYYLFCNYMFYSEKTGKLSLITLSASLINIPLTYFFVKNFWGC